MLKGRVLDALKSAAAGQAEAAQLRSQLTTAQAGTQARPAWLLPTV